MHSSAKSMLNALSIDVEDYFHVEAFATTLSPDDWQTLTPRVEKNVDLILEILAKRETAATFFVLGWVAERFPEPPSPLRTVMRHPVP